MSDNTSQARGGDGETGAAELGLRIERRVRDTAVAGAMDESIAEESVPTGVAGASVYHA